MRDIKTLLEILLYEYQNNTVEWIQLHGLCWAITRLLGEGIISIEETNMLMDYIDYHKPSLPFGGFCWPEGQTSPRIEFLNQLIKIYE